MEIFEDVKEGFDEDKKKDEEKINEARFKLGDPAAYEYLDNNGFVIFSNIANPEQIEELTNLFWLMIRDRCKDIDPNDKSTWNNRNWPGRLDVGTIPTCGQSFFMWRSRIISKDVFVNLYTHLYKTGELKGRLSCHTEINEESKFISSFDGAGAMRDSSQFEWLGHKSWFHTDYDPIKNPNVILYQGFLNLYDCDETTGGFCVIPGSHKQLIRYINETGTNRITGQIPDYLGQPLKINCKSGDFVLWDHSTFHCNTYAEKLIFRKRIERVVAYICMIPVKLVPKEERDTLKSRRKLAAYMGLTTGHNPYTCDPYTYPDLVPSYAFDLI